MASTQAKSTSRWGSLLQQAVAGVESRLDTMLADDGGSSGTTSKVDNAGQPGKREAMVMPTTGRSSFDESRRPSSTRKNNRLQERLAKAVVARNGVNSSDTSRLPSRSTSPTKAPKSPRSSLDTQAEKAETAPYEASATENTRAGGKEDEALGTQSSGLVIKDPPAPATVSEKTQDFVGRLSIDLHDTDSERRSVDSSQPDTNGSQRPTLGVSTEQALRVPPTYGNEVLEQMRSDYEAAELRRQEETHRYLEHIDALQAKLQFLTKETAEAARNAISESELGSMEQKLAMKDEKIALLMEEGQKLSQTELTHMTTIKKLRAKAIEDQKMLKQVDRHAKDLEKAAQVAQERAKIAEVAQQEALIRLKTLQRMKEEIDRLKIESDKKSTLVADLREQLVRAQNGRESNEANKYKDLLEKERKISSDLRDDLSNTKVERELLKERHRTQVRELQETAERDKERAKIIDLELRGELGILESRLETTRVRAEEVSSGSSGNTQAKLLRQIEMLQTQYSVASENWRGIEGSLLARITNLETERDEIARREGDVRRKARTTGTKTRNLEDQLEQAKNKIQEMEQELAECSAKLSSLHETHVEAKAESKKLQNELNFERETWQTRLEERLEIERRDLHSITPELPSPHLNSHFPAVSSRHKVHGDKVSPHGRRPQGGSGLGLVTAGLPFPDRPMSRRHSGQPSQFSGGGTPYRQDSRSSTPQPSTVNGIPETPSIHAEHHDEFLDGLVTPATPERTINDMLSVSTAAAGPSVQLVERMSAAVRRLESEKAAAKDELDRLSAQRDEARDQVVSLMREAEEKRAADGKVLRLETEVAEINQRYQTTLEMLGEKSELVEELKADIADVKQMYRDLVDSTMK